MQAILFDLDGTLLDSAPDLVASLNSVRQSEGLPPLPVDQMSPFASRGAIGLLTNGMPPCDTETFEEWRQRFIAHYADNLWRESRLYPGVPELLDELECRSIPWGIVTNKSEALTRPILGPSGLGRQLGCLVCGDTLENSKPHPEPVEFACRLLGAKPEQTIFVGDDIRDIQAGQSAGTQTAVAHYGYGVGEMDGPLLERSLSVYRPMDLLDLIPSVDPAEVRA